MSRAACSQKHFEARQRHMRIMEILEKGQQPRRYLMMLGLSRSLKWLVDGGLAYVSSRSSNVSITETGRAWLKEQRR